MTDPEGQDPAAVETWTTKYRKPLAVATGALAMLCFWALFSGGAVGAWFGIAGLVVLIAWVFVFRSLYRRGY